MNQPLKTALSPQQLETLLTIGKVRSISMGEYFIRAGETPRKFALLKTGLFRYVYINNKGIEYTKGILLEGDFLSSYSAMITQTPSFFFIEALEDAELLEIDYNNWLELLHKDATWAPFLIKMLEKAFIKKEKRERELLLLDASTRYSNFLKEYPNIEHRLRQHIIASYLGIQPESLSRIKKKLRP